MSAPETLRVAAVLDGTAATAERQARALGGFLREGLRLGAGAQLVAATHLFHADETGREGLLDLAPTADVRLIGTPALRPDLMTAALTAFEAGGGAELYVFPGGPLGTEAGSAPGRPLGRLRPHRRPGRRAHRRGPCLPPARLLEPSHGSVRTRPTPLVHHAWTRAGTTHSPRRRSSTWCRRSRSCTRTTPPLRGHSRTWSSLEQPATGDLEAAEFLVVAGRGAGSRGGVERVAAAAARMGAAFGATRPVVMNAWAPPDRQIGVSGARSAPAVCLTVGASGAPAFLWGVERAGFIAAVDTDEHAAIAGEADAVVIDDGVAVDRGARRHRRPRAPLTPPREFPRAVASWVMPSVASWVASVLSDHRCDATRRDESGSPNCPPYGQFERSVRHFAEECSLVRLTERTSD